MRAETLLELKSILGFVIIIAAIIAIFYGLTAFSENSKFALRLKVTDDYVEYKSAYLRAAARVNWNEIKEMKFDAYKIDFQLNKEVKRFSYRSNPEVSKEIKQLLLQIAEEKSIPVSGG